MHASKFILTAIFLTTASSSFANWTYIDKTPDGSISFYYEPTSITKQKHIATLYELIDFQEPQSKGQYDFQSVIKQTKYDCKNRTSATTYVAMYSGKIGEGNVVFSMPDKNPKLLPILPQTIAESVEKLICK